MKRLSFFSVLLMAASVFLFLGGCQKDEEKFLEAHHKNSIEKNLMPLDSFPKAKRYIERQLRNIGDRNTYFSTTDIDYSQTLVAVTGYNERTYSLALDHDPSEGWIYNIVMHEKDGIEIIKTMIHESVHTGILNVVKGTHINGWGVDDVPDLKYYYDNFTDFHHEYMAGNYFDNLVKSLKEIYGDKYSDGEYEALMWNGLYNTSAYKKLSAAKRNEIESIWDEFKNSKTCEKSCL